MVQIETNYKVWILKPPTLIEILQPFDDLRKNWGYGNPVEGIKHVKYEDMIQLSHPHASRYFPLLREFQRVTDPLFRTLRDVKTGFIRPNDGGKLTDIQEFRLLSQEQEHKQAMENLKKDVLTPYVNANRPRLEALKEVLTTVRTMKMSNRNQKIRNHLIAIIQELLSQS